MNYCESGEEGLVGVGTPPTWVCMTHFRAWLEATKQDLRKFR